MERIARRYALQAADADDLAAWVRERLIDNDYAILRKFGHRSSLRTYLTVVVQNLFRDYRNSRWGRWRPSAEAKRLGPLAIRLEELMYRDGLARHEAVQVLAARGDESERELVRLAESLPRRLPEREVSLDDPEARTRAVGPADASFADPQVQRVFALLCDLVAELPPEDGVILRMHFWDDVSVADVARALGLEQKPLYRRIDAIKARLRASLAERGVDVPYAREILGGDPDP